MSSLIVTSARPGRALSTTRRRNVRTHIVNPARPAAGRASTGVIVRIRPPFSLKTRLQLSTHSFIQSPWRCAGRCRQFCTTHTHTHTHAVFAARSATHAHSYPALRPPVVVSAHGWFQVGRRLRDMARKGPCRNASKPVLAFAAGRPDPSSS
jgi:hypothetical protein